MQDWRQRVRVQLEGCELPSARREDVITELAAHLEETYESALSRGLHEAAAVEVTLREIPDWRVLAVDIGRAKSEEGLMNYRTRSLWLPALTTLLGASVSLALFQYLGMRPRLVWVGNMGMSFYWPWLATLPLFGAIGAYLSQRAQAPASARLASGLSPALVMLIVMCLILPWALAIDGFSFLRFISFGLGLINWVLIPACALLLGAAPLLRNSGCSA